MAEKPRRWNLWRELDRVRREGDRLVDAVLTRLRHELPGRSIAFVPSADIVESRREIAVYVALPGVLEEDIDIACEDNVLTVRGEREAPFDLSRVVRRQSQWRYGYFEIRLELPGPLVTEHLRATFEAGMLTVRIPKS